LGVVDIFSYNDRLVDGSHVNSFCSSLTESPDIIVLTMFSVQWLCSNSNIHVFILHGRQPSKDYHTTPHHELGVGPSFWQPSHYIQIAILAVPSTLTLYDLA